MCRVLISLLLLVAAGCDGYTRLQGKIVDGDGNPIPEAKVSLDRWESKSASDGSFDVGGTHAPSHDPLAFTVTKDGFKTDIRHVPPESNSHMRVVLERERRAKDDLQ